MKRNLFYLLMLIGMMSMFTACGNDDEKLEPIGDEITGVYLGTLDIVVTEIPLGDEGKNIPQKIYITKTGDNSLDLQLKDFSFGDTPMGNIAVENCAAQKTQDGYTFSGSKKGLMLTVGACDVELTGTIVGETVKVAISVVAAGSLHVSVDFTGEKLDKDLSSEAKILTFAIDNEKVLGQPVISEEEGTIKFNVTKEITVEELSQLIPEFTISENATVTPASGEAQDFSEDKVVTYTVISQDGIVKKEYKVSVGAAIYHYSFDEWSTKTETVVIYKGTFPIISNNDWSSSNAALIPIGSMGYYEKNKFPIVEVKEEGFKGSAASITTFDTKGGIVFGNTIPKITAGTLFTGTFKVNMSTPLKSTSFGISFPAEPVALKGYYKYTPGEKYYQVGSKINEATEDPDQHDECSIVAVLYDAESYSLDGINLNNPSNVVFRAELTDGNKVAEWKEFEIPFEAKNGFVYDAAKSYKLAIVCSSSKNGANYSGAPGSVLMIDEFEVVTK